MLKCRVALFNCLTNQWLALNLSERMGNDRPVQNAEFVML